MYKLLKVLSIALVLILISISIAAQDDSGKKEDRHTFQIIFDVEATPVKNQDWTGTCWCFSTKSFLESELMRKGKGEHDLSEMFTVRHTYPMKAEKYIRYHGKYNFGPGGQAHDVINVMKQYGLVPEDAYPGKIVDDEIHNHGEMDAVLKSILNGVLSRKGRELTSLWPKVIESTLDVYLGEVPEQFEYNGKTYTPKSFLEELELNPGDYVELTSYTHHPFYSKFILEVPDNWSTAEYYNLPLDELIRVMDYALENGYSIEWDGDTGKDHFPRDEGYAVIPLNDENEESEENQLQPEKEKTITQDIRQEAFNNFSVTDDHLMHITGLAENQEGTKFYYTKNSWGTEDKKYSGYWYMSEQYVKLKTIAIMMHKDAIPRDIKEKLKL